MTQQRPYADNGEMREIIKSIDEKLERIEGQTLKTNGRVSSLERFKAAMMAVVTVLVLEAGWLIAIVMHK